MSILTENYVAGCFGYVATYPCNTFGPPKPAPGDIYIHIFIYIYIYICIHIHLVSKRSEHSVFCKINTK